MGSPMRCTSSPATDANAPPSTRGSRASPLRLPNASVSHSRNRGTRRGPRSRLCPADTRARFRSPPRRGALSPRPPGGGESWRQVPNPSSSRVQERRPTAGSRPGRHCRDQGTRSTLAFEAHELTWDFCFVNETGTRVLAPDEVAALDAALAQLQVVEGEASVPRRRVERLPHDEGGRDARVPRGSVQRTAPSAGRPRPRSAPRSVGEPRRQVIASGGDGKAVTGATAHASVTTRVRQDVDSRLPCRPPPCMVNSGPRFLLPAPAFP